MDAPEDTRRRALGLRKRMSPVEALVWQRLRNRGLGALKFRRQHPIGPYTLDFYCPEAKLVVEIDGSTHATERSAEADAFRTRWLEAQGLKVIRFWARDVYADLDGVLEAIGTTAHARIRDISDPPLASAAPPPVSAQRAES